TPVQCAAASGTDLYIMGPQVWPGTPVSYGVWHWDGAAWQLVGQPLPDLPRSAAIYQGAPLVSAANGGVYRYNGSTWIQIGLCAGGGVVYAMATFGTDLIAAGNFSSISGVAATHVARWDGSVWHAMGDPSIVNPEALAVFNSSLYIAGSSYGQPRNISRW